MLRLVPGLVRLLLRRGPGGAAEVDRRPDEPVTGLAAGGLRRGGACGGE